MDDSESIIPALMEKYHSIIKLYNSEKIKNNHLEATVQVLKEENAKLSSELKESEENLVSMNRKYISLQMATSELKMSLNTNIKTGSNSASIPNNSSKVGDNINTSSPNGNPDGDKALVEFIKLNEEQKNEYELKIQHIIYMNETKNKELTEYIEKLQSRINDKKSEIEDLKNQNEDLTKKTQELEEKTQNLAEELQQVTIEKQQYLDNLSILTKQYEEVHEEKESLRLQSQEYAQRLFEQRSKIIFLENNGKKIFIHQVIPWKGKTPGYLRIYTSKENAMCLDICINSSHHPLYIRSIIDISFDTKDPKRFIIRYGNNMNGLSSESVSITSLCQGEFILESEDCENVVYILKQVILYEQLQMNKNDDNNTETLPAVPSPYSDDIVYDYESFFA